jgi:hypothetical protein
MTAFEFEIDKKRISRLSVDAPRIMRGKNLVQGLRGGGEFEMTTDEVVALMRRPIADDA